MMGGHQSIGRLWFDCVSVARFLDTGMMGKKSREGVITVGLVSVARFLDTGMMASSLISYRSPSLMFQLPGFLILE